MNAQVQTHRHALETVTHSLTAEDSLAMAGMRKQVAGSKGMLRGIAARAPFDAIMGHVAAPEGVTFQEDIVGGVSGWWCRPSGAPADAAILHLHGGWYNWGSALAYRNLVGQIAMRAGVSAFVPDYRLAPENPFPAGLNDAKTVYAGLLALGFLKIAVTGDSAGGGLALALLSALDASKVPVAAALISPVTDLTLSGESWSTRAEADPYFVREQVEALVQSYLNGHEARDPLASPLFGDLAVLPALLVHVGGDEVLLDDSVRLAKRAVDAGVDARLEIWTGMPHGFVGAVGALSAAGRALESVGSFLARRLT